MRSDLLMRGLLLGVALVCASSRVGAQRAERRCADVAIDSSTAGAPIYAACHVDRPARESGPKPAIAWKPNPGDAGDLGCFRVTFEFVVDTLGVPERGTIRTITTFNPAFTEAVRASLPQLRYTPAVLGGRPVRQRVVYRRSVGVIGFVSSAQTPTENEPRPPRC